MTHLHDLVICFYQIFHVMETVCFVYKTSVNFDQEKEI